jgi:hypothetical protein
MGILNSVIRQATGRRGAAGRRPRRRGAARPAGAAGRQRDEAIGRGVRGLLRKVR